MSVSPHDRSLIDWVLAKALPDLSVRRIHFLGEGWDNRLFVVNEDLVIRVARREVDDARLLAEVRLLEAVGPSLPLPVPRPKFDLQPSADLPRAVMGYHLIPGSPLRAGMVTPANVESFAAGLAPFLDRLHAQPLDIARAAGLPIFSPSEWLARHRELVDQAEPALEQSLDRESLSRFQAWWSAFAVDPVALDFTPCLVHGDLAEEHVLVSADPWRVSGVIDFGDAMVADPALDLAGLPDDLARSVMRRTSSVVNPNHVWERRSAYRKLSPLHAIVAGLERGDSSLLEEGILGLKSQING